MPSHAASQEVVSANSANKGPLTYAQVLKFVPLVSSPSGNATGEYLSQGPRKGRHWAYILLPSPGPRKCQPQTRKGRNHLACYPRLRQWTAYSCVPLDQTALHRPAATLVVSCYWFPQPLVGSTYPRDHVKVARGLSILCPTPGWDEPRRRYVSERDGGEGLTSSGGQGDSEVCVDRQK